MMERNGVLVSAAILFAATGLGYSLGNIIVTAPLIRNRTLPTIAGIQFYAGGFFDRKGVNWVIAASLLLHLVGLVSFPIALWLWNSMKLGGIVALGLYPVAMAIFLGAGAPYPPWVESLKVVLVLVAWDSLV